MGVVTYKASPAAFRHSLQGLQDQKECVKNSTRSKTEGFTAREWYKGSRIVDKVRLWNRDRNLHYTLGNKPPLWPEFVREWAEIPGVPLDYERMDRHGGSLWEITETLLSTLDLW